MQEADLSEGKLQSIEFSDCDLRKIQLLHTPLDGIDLRSCEIGGLKLNLSDLKGAIVTAQQAIELAAFLGIIIQ